MGKSLTPAVLTVFGTCLLRIVWVYGVSPVWRGYDVLMMVYPVSWVVTGLLVLTAYWLFIRKKRLALNKKEIAPAKLGLFAILKDECVSYSHSMVAGGFDEIS